MTNWIPGLIASVTSDAPGVRHCRLLKELIDVVDAEGFPAIEARADGQGFRLRVLNPDSQQVTAMVIKATDGGFSILYKGVETSTTEPTLLASVCQRLTGRD